HERAKQADIVITTALIPGRKAPTLLSADAVALAAVNVFGGFLVTRRMLEMFKKKAPKVKEEAPK
ncbi:proton-translocating transhydrogenase family protein, partial [Pseudomonas iridis]|uniref:proton-translocating transhydrogenase family protein n=1 Tax=Pseudomonas iridis TaxID=2710587 RepID=UPI00381C23A1